MRYTLYYVVKPRLPSNRQESLLQNESAFRLSASNQKALPILIS